MLVSRRTARRLGFGRRRRAVLIGRGRARLPGAGMGELTVRITRAARRRLPRSGRIAATLSFRVLDPRGNRALRRGRLVLKKRTARLAMAPQATAAGRAGVLERLDRVRALSLG
jgi:hypothetical protein